MAIKTYKPTTPSRRHMTVSAFEGIDKKAKPERSLTENLKKIQGSRWWKLHEKMKPVISFARRMGQIVKRFVR